MRSTSTRPIFIRPIAILASLLLASLVMLLPMGLPEAQQIVASLTVLIGALWFTEAIPLWATAMGAPALLILFSNTTPAAAFAPFFDPVVALLLGGLVLGAALQKHGLDRRLVALIVAVSGKGPGTFLLGLMAATAFLSFWMSNTAAAAVMMPVAVATIVSTRLKRGSNYAKALVLGTGYAATIGGIGTLIGTPPNLIAVRWLSEIGAAQITFFDWMIKAMPLVIIMVPLAWLVLMRLYKPELKRITPARTRQKRITFDQKAVLLIFAATAVMWLAEPIHGVHNSVIAMLPIILYFGLGLLDNGDVGRIGWDVLILIGGGLTLGNAIFASGLAGTLANGAAGLIAGQPMLTLFIVLALFSVAITIFVSNTGAAAILIPIVLPLAQVLGISQVATALLVGIAVSFDFLVPVGTPPNAIAYGTGRISVKDMLKAGVLLSLLGAVAIALIALGW